MFGQSPTPAPSAAAIDTTQEQDDLQLAIAMSLNEQENKVRQQLLAQCVNTVQNSVEPGWSSSFMWSSEKVPNY